ncbi:17730_t:CDS:2 [Entrophospora sp. SA101]|nr:17730_t:CDS:2 [Entrophospora sp. SA101]
MTIAYKDSQYPYELQTNYMCFLNLRNIRTYESYVRCKYPYVYIRPHEMIEISAGQ